MTVGSLTSVFDRIGAIETRFGRSTPPKLSSAQMSPGTGDDFSTVLGEPTTVNAPEVSAAASADTSPRGPSVYATPIAPDTTGVGALLGGLDRLAAMGLLAPSNGGIQSHGAGNSSTHLDRLAAIGALPTGGHGHDHGHDHSPIGARPHSVPSSTGVVGGSSVAAPVPGHAHSHADAHGGVSMETPFAAEFDRAGYRHGVPSRLLAAVGWVESRYRTDAVSPDGAIGVMQLMPMTAQELGVDPHDPVDAIDGAARLLASHQRRFGSWDLALAAYFSGAGAVSRNGNQAPPRAAAYVERVHDRLENS